jgi:AraC-like DNA-binding protein
MRRDGFENFLVNVSLTGGERGLADDRSMAVPRGAVAVCDLARPFSYDFPLRAEVFTLVVSRTALEERLGAVDDLHGLVLAPERVALMADHVAWLGAHLPLGGNSAAEVNDTVLDLFAAAARPDGAVLERTRDSVARAGFSRACRFIDANLASRGLTPDRIARTAGVSRSALYRLFEPYGGVAAHVRRRRLEAARDAVLDPQDPRRLADLAQDLGFPSQALFSRQFRETFGCTPRELRGVGRAEAIDAGGTAARYLDWVKGLR